MSDLKGKLFSETSLNNADRAVMGYETNTDSDRGDIRAFNIKNASIGSAQIQDASITNAKIANLAVTSGKINDFSFNSGTGGTLTLGGSANGNGLLIVKDANGSTAVNLNNSQLIIYDSTGKRQFLANYEDGYLQLNSVRVGGTAVTQSGAIFLYDSGNNNFGELSVDRFYFAQDTYIGANQPFVLEGTAAQTNPSGTNQANLFVDLSGGKHRLMVRFGTGTAIPLAVEP